MVQLKNLGKTFLQHTSPVVAIRDISLTIDDGDIFGIIGLSGAGKSTLVRCINFLEKPTEGQVLFKGVDVDSLSPAQITQAAKSADGYREGMSAEEMRVLCRERGVDLGVLTHRQLLRARQKMSMIFQSFNLLEQRNVLRNVLYPLEIMGVNRAEAVRKARSLLEIVGLADREKAYPAQLSGGQKQRVAIARALATDPMLLLCDEATSALDPNTTRAILDLLKKINREMGVTIIVITHEMKVIEQICGKVAVIDHSHIVEEGLVKDVFLAPKSAIARQLILPAQEAEAEGDSRRVRIVFDGSTAFEPVISSLSQECRAAVNILSANTKVIDGKAYGQMILLLPEEADARERALTYLKTRNIRCEEVG